MTDALQLLTAGNLADRCPQEDRPAVTSSGSAKTRQIATKTRLRWLVSVGRTRGGRSTIDVRFLAEERDSPQLAALPARGCRSR
jgi:hypothetical protein